MIFIGLLLGLVGFVLGYVTKVLFTRSLVADAYMLGYTHALSGFGELLEKLPLSVRSRYGLYFPEEVPTCPTNNDKPISN